MSRADVDIDGLIGRVVASSKAAVEGIGAGRIEAFLETRPDVSGPLKVSELRGGGARAGASSGIVLFTAELEGGAVRRKLVLRYGPKGDARLFHEYDLEAQFRIQQVLQATDVPTPKACWIDRTGEHLGVPGFVMEQVEGEVPSASPFTSGFLHEASPERRRRLLGELLDTLVRIHRVDWRALSLGDFVKDAAGETPIARFVEWFWKTWTWVSPPAAERLEPVRAWLLRHRPEVEVSLMHGDPTFSNYMFRDDRVVAALDWELASLGHGELDVAAQSLVMEFFERTGGGRPEGVPSPSEWVALYEERRGQAVRHPEYFRRLAAYMCIIVFESLGRRLPVEAQAAQRKLAELYWNEVE